MQHRTVVFSRLFHATWILGIFLSIIANRNFNFTVWRIFVHFCTEILLGKKLFFAISRRKNNCNLFNILLYSQKDEKTEEFIIQNYGTKCCFLRNFARNLFFFFLFFHTTYSCPISGITAFDCEVLVFLSMVEPILHPEKGKKLNIQIKK